MVRLGGRSRVEEWRVCADHPAYEVSSLGRVRRIATSVVLKPWSNGRGYMKVTLIGRKKEYVHRLFAKAFLGISNDQQVDHQFHDLTDVHAIRPVTHAQNCRNSRGWKGRS